MALSSSPPHTTAAVLDDPDDPVLRGATCPMCHTPTAVTEYAIEAGANWRCVRCRQHWDAARLVAIAGYAAWIVAHDPAGLRQDETN